MKSYPALFEPCKLGGKIAPNRFVAQPMEGNDSDRGHVSEMELQKYINLARGGWGIIIVEAISITEISLARKNQLILNTNTFDSFRNLIKVIRREAPDTVILFQITHSGRKSVKDFSLVTALYDPSEEEHLLTTEEIEDIKNKFIETAVLAEKAGADGIDLKLCHGYFGCEMLRPANIRNDRWGGSFENRTRLLKESIKGIRIRLNGSPFILGSRISYYEGIRGGCGTASGEEIIEDLNEMDALIVLMDSIGMDYVNVSAGIPGVTSEITRPASSSMLFYLHQFRYAQRAKRLVKNMKVIGSAYSVLKDEGIDLAEENISKHYTDFAGWGRQILTDPLFPDKIKRRVKIDYCTACSGCSKLLVKQKNVGCITVNNYYRDLLNK